MYHVLPIDTLCFVCSAVLFQVRRVHKNRLTNRETVGCRVKLLPYKVMFLFRSLYPCAGVDLPCLNGRMEEF